MKNGSESLRNMNKETGMEVMQVYCGEKEEKICSGYCSNASPKKEKNKRNPCVKELERICQVFFKAIRTHKK